MGICQGLHRRRDRRRYTGRVEHFEVWNELDGHWCWKHGVNPAEYAQLVIDTAKAVKKGNPKAQVLAGALAFSKFLFASYFTCVDMIEAEGTITLQVAALKGDIRLIDLIDGAVYEIPESMIEDCGDNCLIIKNLPIKDYPMALTFGEFHKGFA